MAAAAPDFSAGTWRTLAPAALETVTVTVPGH